MSATTIYDVKLRYSVDNRPGVEGTKVLSGEVGKLNREAEKFSSLMGRAVAGAAGIFGVREAKKHLVDFNSEVQNAKIGLSAMLEGNLGGTWETAAEREHGLYTSSRSSRRSRRSRRRTSWSSARASRCRRSRPAVRSRT
jgi:hypothetical protein